MPSGRGRHSQGIFRRDDARTTEDGHGLVPADATAEYICTLDGSREERAFQRAKYSYYDFLDYKDDCYTTVSGYMN